MNEGYYEIELKEEGLIDSNAYSEVYRWLSRDEREEYKRYSGWINTLFTWTDKDSPWRKWIAQHEYKGEVLRGKWTTRFSKWYHIQTKENANEEIVSLIGEKLKASIRENIKYHFEVAKFTTWEHGAFEGSKSPDGKAPGKCWWQNPPSVSTRLGMEKDPRGYSVLFYKDTEQHAKYSRRKGIGRCWLVEMPEGLVIFNAYNIRLVTIAQLLSSLYDLPYHKINVYSDHAFINAGYDDNAGRDGGSSGVGIIIAKDIPRNGRVHLPDMRLRDKQCEYCHSPVVSDDCIKANKGYACKECQKKLTHCEHCGNYEMETHASRNRGHVVKICTQCKENYEKTCHFCGPTLDTLKDVWHTSYKVCIYCEQAEKVAQCYECNRRVVSFITIKGYAGRSIHICKTDWNRRIGVR